MTDAVKLLTEAEWREVLAHTDSDDDVIEALRERDHLAPEPTCPLLEEAREIAAKACEYNGHPETGEYMRSVDPANSTTLAAALAALKRGMEMANTSRSEPCSPPPRWVQDSIPDWAFERVAQLVGYGDKHGPRGSRAGVAFARYLADNPTARPPLTREALVDAFIKARIAPDSLSAPEFQRLHAALTKEQS